MKDIKTKDQKLIQLALHIEQHAEQNLSLATLAKQNHMSPSYLQKQFKALIGISPKAFQNAIRIQKIKQSLKQGQNISSAIYEAGFGSSSRLYEQVNQQLGMKPSSFKKGGLSENISFALRQTHFGHIIMAATDRGVCFVQFADNFSELMHALKTEFPHAELTATPEDSSVALEQWMTALEQHLTQAKPCPSLPLHLYGTAFQIKVWKFLVSIKQGTHASYKQVAEQIGNAKGFRAVANACAANKIALLIPCHRVLRGDGSLGGYRWGIDRKKQLLQLEKQMQ